MSYGRAKPIEFQQDSGCEIGLIPTKQESNFFNQEDAVVEYSQLSAPQ